MEAIGAAASVLAIIEVVGRVSASAASFMHDIKGARKDMIQVRKDMAGLSMVLRMVAEDLDHHDHSAPGNSAPHSQKHIVGIANSCSTVLLEIEAVLGDDRSRLSWVMFGKERVDTLRARLETCKMSLDVALDYRTMVIVHDIKADSTQIVRDLSAVQRDVALLLEKVDNIEQKAPGGHRSADGTDMSLGGFMLDRFLNEYRSDAQTVLDNIEYQQDLEFVPPQQVQADTQGAAPEFAPSSQILFRNSLGHEYPLPLKQCRMWKYMEEMIKCSYPPGSADAEEIKNGRYTLYHDGQAVPLASWDDFVSPGRSVSLKLWEDDTIKFIDAVGRKFNFPWRFVKTWEGIEDLVTKAFHHVDFLRPFIQKGCYDLIGPDNTVILPGRWEQFVKPGMGITMRMWSSEQDTQVSEKTGDPKERRTRRPDSYTPKKKRIKESNYIPIH